MGGAAPEAAPFSEIPRSKSEMNRMKRKRQPIPPAYRAVSRMSGQELLDSLTAPLNASMATLIRIEVELRLVDGLKQSRCGSRYSNIRNRAL